MDRMIQIGPSEASVRAAREAIVEIVTADCDEHTKAVALQALKDICQVTGTAITGCTFYGGKMKP